jgi:hypothetical protein
VRTSPRPNAGDSAGGAASHPLLGRWCRNVDAGAAAARRRRACPDSAEARPGHWAGCSS